VLIHGATLNGTLNDDGGEACDCGFEWGLTVAYGNTTPTQSRTTGQTFSQAINTIERQTTIHFRAFATNAAGTIYGADRTFLTLAEVPTPTTNTATALLTTSATLNGLLADDGGEACDCGFEWGLTAAYGNTTPTTSHITGNPFSQGIVGLSPFTTYHFRAFATNSKGTGYGADRTFKTPAEVPTVTTDPAIPNTFLADLCGTLDDDGGEPCDCGFEWGLTVAYGNTTPTQSRNTGETFNEIITGLLPSTTYHFRAFATNSGGTGFGADVTLTTAATPPGVVPPTVDTIGTTSITLLTATLLGELSDDGGEACEVRFQYGLTATYGNDTPWQIGKVTGNSFQQGIVGLSPFTIYHFRAQAKNAMGLSNGIDMTFETWEALTKSKAHALSREEF